MPSSFNSITAPSAFDTIGFAKSLQRYVIIRVIHHSLSLAVTACLWQSLRSTALFVFPLFIAAFRQRNHSSRGDTINRGARRIYGSRESARKLLVSSDSRRFGSRYSARRSFFPRDVCSARTHYSERCLERRRRMGWSAKRGPSRAASISCVPIRHPVTAIRPYYNPAGRIRPRPTIYQILDITCYPAMF